MERMNGSDRVVPRLARSRRTRATLLLSAPLLFALPLEGPSAPLAAQELPASFGTPDPDPDFLFRQPRFFIGLRGGLFLHGAGSDLFDFTEERFTIDRCQFLVDACAYRGPSFGIEGGFWLGSRAEVMIGLDGSWVSIDSEYRDFVEDDGSADGIPIRQTTRLRQGPTLSFGARYYLTDRGDRLGRFIWAPRRWNAFLMAGGGLASHKLSLSGDFVEEFVFDRALGIHVPCLDHPDGCLISTERFISDGHTFFPFVGAGLEMRLTPRTALMLEGRYRWGSHRLGRDFAADFVEPLDLSGARLTIGIFYSN